jgi:hypothetical protein
MMALRQIIGTRTRPVTIRLSLRDSVVSDLRTRLTVMPPRSGMDLGLCAVEAIQTGLRY